MVRRRPPTARGARGCLGARPNALRISPVAEFATQRATTRPSCTHSLNFGRPLSTSVAKGRSLRVAARSPENHEFRQLHRAKIQIHRRLPAKVLAAPIYRSAKPPNPSGCKSDCQKGAFQRFLGILRTLDWRTADFGRLVIAVFRAQGITKRWASRRSSLRSVRVIFDSRASTVGCRA